MISFVTDNTLREKCYDFIKDKAHIYEDHKTFSYIGIIEDNKILGVIYFCDYDGNNIFIHAALDTPRACNLRAIKLMFDYIFNQIKCNRATITCDVDNKKAIRLSEGLGFEREGTMKKMLYFKNKFADAAVYGLQKEDCKWVKA